MIIIFPSLFFYCFLFVIFNLYTKALVFKILVLKTSSIRYIVTEIEVDILWVNGVHGDLNDIFAAFVELMYFTLFYFLVLNNYCVQCVVVVHQSPEWKTYHFSVTGHLTIMGGLKFWWSNSNLFLMVGFQLLS